MEQGYDPVCAGSGKVNSIGAFTGDTTMGKEQLTRREQFVLAAMQGLLAADSKLELEYRQLAEYAVTQADHVLNKLDGKEEQEEEGYGYHR
jgi:hypothetical protein